MSKYDDLITGLSAVLDNDKANIGQASIAATNDVIEMLEELNESYDKMLENAINYANEHMLPSIVPEGPSDGKPTSKNFSTVLFTTESAASDPSFDEALTKYPGVRADDLQERLEYDKQETMEYVETEMLEPLKVRLMCTVRTYNTWNGSTTHVVSREDAGVKDLFGICRSSKDYEDYAIYCSDGQLRLMMKHHDATDHCVCMRIINEDEYWKLCTQHVMSDKNADEIVKELTERGIAESLVPDIARILGVTLEDDTPEKADTPGEPAENVGADGKGNPLRDMLREDDASVKESCPEADENVLAFITDMMSHTARSEEEYETLRSTFRGGYCYYFAHMLKQAFDRGEVCWAAPFGHMVWTDVNGMAYDVEGAYVDGEEAYLIPESYLGESVRDYMRVPGMEIPDTPPDKIIEIIRKYEADKGLEPADLSYYHIGRKTMPTD